LSCFTGRTFFSWSGKDRTAFRKFGERSVPLREAIKEFNSATRGGKKM